MARDRKTGDSPPFSPLDRKAAGRRSGDSYYWVAVALLALTAIAAVGASRVGFSDDYQEIFRDDSAAFGLLEEVSRQFGSDDAEVLVALEAGDVLAPEPVAALERLTRELEAIEGVSGVVSPTRASGLLALTARSTDESLRASARAAIGSHPLLAGHLIAPGGDAALIVVRLDPNRGRLADVEPVLGAIDRVVESVRSTGAEVLRTGLPYLRSETVRSVQRDQHVFTAVGLLLGAALAIAAFRDARLALAVGTGPAIGVLWMLGAMGWIGEPLNVVNNVAPVLVLVIGMTDSVHFGRAFQQRRAGGAEQRAAATDAAWEVAPACTLTSLTTIVGFSSLALADVAIVQRFGWTCAGGLALSWLAVLTAGPLLAGWTPLGRAWPRPALALPSLLGRAMTLSQRYPWVIALVSGLLLVGGAVSGARLEPDFRYREYLPAASSTLRDLTRIERAFGGLYPVRVVVDWPEGAAEREVLSVLEAVEGALDESSLTRAPFSLLAPLRAIAGPETPVEELPSGDVVPAPVRDRLWRPELRRAVVEARAPDLGAAELEPHLRELETSMARVALAHPGFEIAVNGLLPVSARTSLEMLSSLAESLAVACVVIFVTLAAALRSLRLGLVSLIPNLLPLAAICWFLAASGRPLQFTTVTVLTVVLGLAVDDTIHLLAGFRRARRAGAGVEGALSATLQTVGGSLVLTTALLVAGFGAVGLSRAPMMALFGWLAAGALIVALATDLVVLPALVRLAHGTPGGPGEGRGGDLP